MKTKNKRKICVVTGTRAEYGLLKPVMRATFESSKLKLQILVTGMHLLPMFGSSYKEIEKDGFSIDAKVKVVQAGNSSYEMAKSVGESIVGIAGAFSRLKPDVVVILGDRVEALAAAVAASYMNIFLAHLHGGDVTKGGVDENNRHAITKMANIHFPATKKSAERIIKMGENPKNVYLVGAPCLDTILHANLLSAAEVVDKYSLNISEPVILLIQHSVTTQVNDAGKQMIQTLEAIKELGLQTVLIYPNTDAGGKDIIRVIKKYKKLPYIKVYKNIPHLDYLSILKIASVMVGNSSSGIIETASFCVPCVNIGTRQDGRERSTNIIDVPHKKEEIMKAIKKAVYNKEFLQKIKRCKNVYGGGETALKVVKILSTINLDERLLQKSMTY